MIRLFASVDCSCCVRESSPRITFYLTISVIHCPTMDMYDLNLFHHLRQRRSNAPLLMAGFSFLEDADLCMVVSGYPSLINRKHPNFNKENVKIWEKVAAFMGKHRTGKSTSVLTRGLGIGTISTFNFGGLDKLSLNRPVVGFAPHTPNYF